MDPLFSERLKKLRTERDLTPKELANIFEVSESTIRMYESNSRSPQMDMIIKMSKFFNVSTDYLLGTDYKKTTPEDLFNPNTTTEQKLSIISENLFNEYSESFSKVQQQVKEINDLLNERIEYNENFLETFSALDKTGFFNDIEIENLENKINEDTELMETILDFVDIRLEEVDRNEYSFVEQTIDATESLLKGLIYKKEFMKKNLPNVDIENKSDEEIEEYFSIYETTLKNLTDRLEREQDKKRKEEAEKKGIFYLSRYDLIDDIEEIDK